jgi:phenylacetic acid degradation operon negative regulatory protein
VNARAALFDLYGDHLLSRGGAAPVAGLIRALGALGIAAPAVRTAISRMVSQGWLEARREGGGTHYSLTGRAVQRLDEAGARIYRTRDETWDGSWELLVVERSADRSRRERVKIGLRYLGYGAVDGTTWLAARPSAELDTLLRSEGIHAERFRATHDSDTRSLVARVWDLPALAAAYESWLDGAKPIASAVTARSSDQRAFAARTELVHEWRKFLFTDPALPVELLPNNWPGHRAARYFDDQAQRLLPAATRFVDHCMAAAENDNE